jgi:hypothetical protein
MNHLDRVMTLDGMDIAFIPPGLPGDEIGCVQDWIDGYRDEGLDSEAIRRQAGKLYTGRWGKFWGRAWGRPGASLETLAAIHSRVVDILLARPRPDQGSG